MDPFPRRERKRKLVEVLHSSEKLGELEIGIKYICATVVLSKKEVCYTLGRIQREKLYKQAGFRDFKSYLKANRVPFPYATAMEYARIGIALAEDPDQLARIRFNEEDGLKKIAYLPQAIKSGRDEQEVFRKLQNSTVKEFHEYARAFSPSGLTQQGRLASAHLPPGDIITSIVEQFCEAPDSDRRLISGIAYMLKELSSGGLLTIKQYDVLVQMLKTKLKSAAPKKP